MVAVPVGYSFAAARADAGADAPSPAADDLPGSSLDDLADQLDAAIAARDFYAARAAAALLMAFTGGRPAPRAAVLMMRAPTLPTDDDNDAENEAAWLETLPRRRRKGRP